MRLIIDGQEQDGLRKYGSGELEQEIASLHKAGRYVQSVTCNGQEANLDDLLQGRLNLAAEAQVEVVTCTLDELIENTMDSAHDYLPRLYSVWQEIIHFWRTGEWEEGAERFATTIAGLQWNLAVLTDIKALGPDDSEIALINRQGQAIVAQLLSAWEKEDFIQLADILEYEALPWLDQWFGFADLFRQQMKLEHIKAKLN